MRAAVQTPKIRLVHKVTGQVVEAWPVDAREHLAAGDFVREVDLMPATDADTDDQTEPDDDEPVDPKLPGIRALAAFIASLPDDAVQTMQATDSRKSAAAIYAARLTPKASE